MALAFRYLYELSVHRRLHICFCFSKELYGKTCHFLSLEGQNSCVRILSYELDMISHTPEFPFCLILHCSIYYIWLLFFVPSEISSILRYVTQMVVGTQQIMGVGWVISY